MTKRYLGNIITQNPTPPAGPYQDSAASGVWSLAEAFAYSKAGLWPIPGNSPLYGLFGGGNPATNVIERIDMATLGDSTDFGDLTVARQKMAGLGSATVAVFGGGFSETNIIESLGFATAGNATDFGDLTNQRHSLGGLSSSTRGVFGGGYAYPASRNIMDYISIASAGNATDFGDLAGVRQGLGACSSPTRGLFIAGSFTLANDDTGLLNSIEFITIASAGNATDFGDVTTGTEELAAGSSSTRAVFGGGYDRSAYLNTIEYLTIASAGNATDFGNLTVARRELNTAAASSSIRVVFAGGSGGAEGDPFNTMDYVTVATTGNALDFGDLTVAKNSVAGCSNAHGGLAA